MEEQHQSRSGQIELLDFWAVWCGPCKVMAPILAEIEHDYADKIAIRKINVDEPESQPLVDQYRVMSIPTYLLRQDGEVVDMLIGIQSKAIMAQRIDAVLK